MRFAAAGISVRGPAHVEQQLPNQDAVMLHGYRGGWVGAVCDGVGSARHSQVGSRVAAQAVRQVLKGADGADASRINAGIHACWRDRIVGYQVKDVATTCLWLTVNADGNATFGQLGDGLILFRQGGRLFQLTPPRQGYGNQTHALYDTHTPAQWLQGTCTLSNPGDGVVLLTDGISDDLLPDALDGFYRAVFNNVRARSRRNAQRWLGCELEQWSTPMHGDDKSLVAIFKTS